MYCMNSSKPSQVINVRQSAIMKKVEGKIRNQYHSDYVDQIIANGNRLQDGKLDIHLASSFGFCNGVVRAIDMAYATRESFPDETIWLIGEIIHNPEVNAQLDKLGLKRLPWQTKSPDYDQIRAGDVVILPAFGVTVGMRNDLEEKGVRFVDTTCGNVVKVWRNVASFARQGITSIIHGKTKHEETMATASHSRGKEGHGKFLIIFSSYDADFLADTIIGKHSREEFLQHFKGSYSLGFNPTTDLDSIGVANQTTMLQNETKKIHICLKHAIIKRDGDALKFHVCDTICGATQDRQNALHQLLDKELDTMFIVGGYNSSNTTHLAEIASQKMETYFIQSAANIIDNKYILAYNLKTHQEEKLSLPSQAQDSSLKWEIGITAGASCPANLIESIIKRLIELRKKD